MLRCARRSHGGRCKRAINRYIQAMSLTGSQEEEAAQMASGGAPVAESPDISAKTGAAARLRLLAVACMGCWRRGVFGVVIAVLSGLTRHGGETTLGRMARREGVTKLSRFAVAALPARLAGLGTPFVMVPFVDADNTLHASNENMPMGADVDGVRTIYRWGDTAERSRGLKAIDPWHL